MRGILKGALGEAVSEGVEEGGGQALSNVAVRQVDPTQSLSEGVGAAAGEGAATGLVLGGGSNAVSGVGGAIAARGVDATTDMEFSEAGIDAAAHAAAAGVAPRPMGPDPAVQRAQQLAIEKEALRQQADDAQAALAQAESVSDAVQAFAAATEATSTALDLGTQEAEAVAAHKAQAMQTERAQQDAIDPLDAEILALEQEAAVLDLPAMAEGLDVEQRGTGTVEVRGEKARDFVQAAAPGAPMSTRADGSVLVSARFGEQVLGAFTAAKQATACQATPGQAPAAAQTDVQPVRHGAFGPIFTEYRGDAQGAIARLMQERDGEAQAALSHPEIGDIDLVWGVEGEAKNGFEGGYGLAKIAAKHPEVIADLQGIVASLPVTKSGRNRAVLSNDAHTAVVRLQWNEASKRWLLTAYENDQDGLGGAGTRTGAAQLDGGARPPTANPERSLSRSAAPSNSPQVLQSRERTAQTAAAEEAGERPSPMLMSNGKPFATEKAAASSARQRKLDMRPVPVEGGWGLVPNAQREGAVPDGSQTPAAPAGEPPQIDRALAVETDRQAPRFSRRKKSGDAEYLAAVDGPQRADRHAVEDGPLPEAKRAEVDAQYKATERAYGGREGYERAKAAGRTKLNYRQWVQVRTPAFKAWFGDWESLQHRQFLDGRSVVILTGGEFAPDGVPLTEKVPKWYLDRGVATVEVPDIGLVVLDGRAVKDSFSHRRIERERAAAFAAVPDVLRDGVIIGRAEWDGARGGGMVYHVAAPIRIAERSFVLNVVVRSDQNSRRMYVHEVVAKEKLQRVSAFKTGADAAEAGAHTGTETAGAVRSVLQRVYGVNPATVSKATDPETGEPMGMHHGTSADFSAFDASGNIERSRGSRTQLPDGTVASLTGAELGEFGGDVRALRKAAIRWYQENLQHGEPARHPTLGEVRFTKKGRDEVERFSADPDKLKLMPALRQIVEYGELVRTEPLDHPRTDKIKAFHVVEADVSLGGNSLRVQVEIGEDTTGNLFYDIFSNATEHDAKKKARGVPGQQNPGARAFGGDVSASLSASIPDDGLNIKIIGRDDAAPAVTRDTVRDAVAERLPSLAGAVDRMLARGDEGKRGGLVLIESASMDAIAEAYASKTGRSIEDARDALQLSVSADGQRQVMSAAEVEASTEDRHAFRLAVEGIARGRYANKAPVPVTVNTTNEVVFVSWASARHILRDGIPDWKTALAVLHMEPLMRAAEKTGWAPDYKGREDPLGAHFYRSEALIDGAEHTVEITVRQHSDGNRYYDHIVVQEKPPAGLLESGARRDTSNDQPAPPFAGGVESIARKRPDIKRSVNGDIQGFFDPQSGLTFLVAPNLTAESVPAVLLHEATHGRQRADIDARALALIDGRASAARPVRDFLDRVTARMEDAGETGNAEEATAYIVEEAVLAGRQAGFSAVDGPLMDWVARKFGKRVADIVRDFVAMVRGFGLRIGVPLNPGVDDLVAIARGNVRAMARGDVAGQAGQSRIGDALRSAIRGLVELARSLGNENKTVTLGPVTAQQADQLQRESVAVDGSYTHTVDMFAVRHALNRHGDAKAEARIGQLPLGESDISVIPEIVDAPDAWVLGAKTPRGQDIVGSLKRLPDGTVLYLEEVRSGRKTLAMTSMRKYPGTTDFESIKDRIVPSYARSDTGDIRIVAPDRAGSQSGEAKRGGAQAVDALPDKPKFSRAGASAIPPSGPPRAVFSTPTFPAGPIQQRLDQKQYEFQDRSLDRWRAAFLPASIRGRPWRARGGCRRFAGGVMRHGRWRATMRCL